MIKLDEEGVAYNQQWHPFERELDKIYKEAYFRYWDLAGENQYDKLENRGRTGYFGMVKPTLAKPDVIIEVPSPKKDSERNSKLVFAKTFNKPDVEHFCYFVSIGVSMDGIEVSVSSHRKGVNKIRKYLTEDYVPYIKRPLSDESSLEYRQPVSDTQVGSPVSHDDSRATTKTGVITPSGVNSSADTAKVENISDTAEGNTVNSSLRYKMNRRGRQDVILKKTRPDLTDEQRRGFLDFLDTVDRKDYGRDFELVKDATFTWFAAGTIKPDEDMYKVKQAVEVLRRENLIGKRSFDEWKSPMELINSFPKTGYKVMNPPIDPDTVSCLKNKKELPHGVTVYEVDEGKTAASKLAARKQLREIINTHFGKESSPWCLLQGDKQTGELTEGSATMWEHYKAHKKRVAFQNGHLLAFFANSKKDVPLWWDRMDHSHEGALPIEEKLPDDKLGRTAAYEMNEETGELGEPVRIYKGDSERGKYEEWWNNGQIKHSLERDENGQIQGTRKTWYPNGQLSEESEYKNGHLDGRRKVWYENGQLKHDMIFRPAIFGPAPDGDVVVYHENGRIKEKGNYKNGHPIGAYEEYYDNGKPKAVRSYDIYGNGLKLGEQTEWYKNGQLKSHYNASHNLTETGVHEEYYSDGRIKVYEVRDENGKLQGLRIAHDKEGYVEEYYKDGRHDGEYRSFYKNGLPKTKGQYKNGRMDGDWATLMNGGEGGIVVHVEYKNGTGGNRWEEQLSDEELKKNGWTAESLEARRLRTSTEDKGSDAQPLRFKMKERKPAVEPDGDFKPKTKEEGATYVDMAEAIYKVGKAKASEVYGRNFFDVAKTPDILKQYGVTGEKFTIGYGVMSDHIGKDTDHDLSLEEWKQLAEALQHPIIIGEYYNEKGKRDGFRIYVRLKVNKNNYTAVGVRVKSFKDKLEIKEVNAISTVFGANDFSINGKLLYKAEDLTPEETSLLDELNPHRYTSDQESGAKVNENSDIDKEDGVDSSSSSQRYRVQGKDKEDSVGLKSDSVGLKEDTGKVSTRSVNAFAKKHGVEAEHVRAYAEAIAAGDVNAARKAGDRIAADVARQRPEGGALQAIERVNKELGRKFGDLHELSERLIHEKAERSRAFMRANPGLKRLPDGRYIYATRPDAKEEGERFDGILESGALPGVHYYSETASTGSRYFHLRFPNGTQLEVRFIVQEDKEGNEGLHKTFLTGVNLYEKEGISADSTGPLVQQRWNGYAKFPDTKLEDFFEAGRRVREKDVNSEETGTQETSITQQKQQAAETQPSSSSSQRYRSKDKEKEKEKEKEENKEDKDKTANFAEDNQDDKDNGRQEDSGAGAKSERSGAEGEEAGDAGDAGGKADVSDAQKQAGQGAGRAETGLRAASGDGDGAAEEGETGRNGNKITDGNGKQGDRDNEPGDDAAGADVAAGGISGSEGEREAQEGERESRSVDRGPFY